MKRTLNRRRLSRTMGAGTAAVAILLLARGFAADKAPPKPPPANIAEAVPPNVIPNANVNRVQQAPANALNLADIGKGVIESPTKRFLAAQTVPGSAPPASEFDNPKVEPGKVRWHKTFAAACAAAKKSGKPVLLFQMMGKLDERFC